MSEEHWTERSFKRVVESFSIFTAASFIISGFANAAIFWSEYRLNYFAIAQPSDIVMSGFLYVSVVLIVSAMIAFMLGFPILARRILPVSAVSLIEKLSRKKLEPEQREELVAASSWVVKKAYRWSNIIVAILFPIALGLSIAFPSDRQGGIHGPPPPAPPPYWQRPLSSAATSNLYLSEDDPQFARCGPAPVLWIGSASVLLNCRGRLRVVQNTQGLILDRLAPGSAD